MNCSNMSDSFVDTNQLLVTDLTLYILHVNMSHQLMTEVSRAVVSVELVSVPMKTQTKVALVVPVKVDHLLWSLSFSWQKFCHLVVRNANMSNNSINLLIPHSTNQTLSFLYINVVHKFLFEVNS